MSEWKITEIAWMKPNEIAGLIEASKKGDPGRVYGRVYARKHEENMVAVCAAPIVHQSPAPIPEQVAPVAYLTSDGRALHFAESMRLLGQHPGDMTPLYAALVAQEVTQQAAKAEAGNVPDGWKLVPIHPTDSMLDAAGRELSMNDESAGAAESDLEYQADAHTAWNAMLAAAPTTSTVSASGADGSAA